MLDTVLQFFSEITHTQYMVAAGAMLLFLLAARLLVPRLVDHLERQERSTFEGWELIDIEPVADTSPERLRKEARGQLPCRIEVYRSPATGEIHRHPVFSP